MQVNTMSSHIFEVPVPLVDPRPYSITASTSRKRKRGDQRAEADAEADQHTQEHTDFDSVTAEPLEYTAVVTPLERAQRRLAGLPLNHDPPPDPFPHACFPSTNDDHSIDNTGPVGAEQHGALPRARPSLHLQHLSAMTAILHRCMMARDYDRAARALGLLLRSEVNGRPVDIRNGGLWGMAAEILLRQRTSRDSQTDLNNRSDIDPIAGAGFARARQFYEQLIIQYPQHKAWPDATNALDFAVALFALWVYVTDQEALRMRGRISVENVEPMAAGWTEVTMQEARVWELEQARRIATAMDARMRDLSFGNNTAMVRLRAMVALWVADLVEQCSDTVDEQEPPEFLYDHIDMTDLSSRIESIVVDRHHSPLPQTLFSEAEQNRTLATSLLQKLRGNA